jgi:nicotinamide mononucleotide transporter
VLNGWLYWKKGIYADMMLEMFYFLTMAYGWHHWSNSAKNTSSETPLLKQLSAPQWLLLLFLFCFVFMIIYTLLSLFTHSSVAFLDATTTSLSLIAQWLMCHKIIITWILWFITDALYALMYLTKGLPFHCGLMILYTGMAVSGYILWARKSNNLTLTRYIKEELINN